MIPDGATHPSSRPVGGGWGGIPEPMLATLAPKPFSREGWIFERKLDGQRCLVVRRPDVVHIYSRSGRPLDTTYPEIVEALAAQPVEDFVADGEIVAFEGGATSFAKLQRRMHVDHPGEAVRTAVPVTFYLFDLLELLGSDLADVDLRRRKILLRRALSFSAPLRFLPHRNVEGEKAYAEACRRGWEGVIAKRASSPYVPGRSRDWLKFKCVSEGEFQVVGFTDSRSGHHHIGALLLARVGADGLLRYAGRVGTGFDDRARAAWRERLAPLERGSVPVEPESLPNRRSRGALPREGVHWITAGPRVRVGFAETTPDGHLRHPRYLGGAIDD